MGEEIISHIFDIFPYVILLILFAIDLIIKEKIIFRLSMSLYEKDKILESKIKYLEEIEKIKNDQKANK